MKKTRSILALITILIFFSVPFYVFANTNTDTRYLGYMLQRWQNGEIETTEFMNDARSWKTCMKNDVCLDENRGFDLELILSTGSNIGIIGDAAYYTAIIRNIGIIAGNVTTYSKGTITPHGGGAYSYNPGFYLLPGQTALVGSYISFSDYGNYTVSVFVNGTGEDGSDDMNIYNNKVLHQWRVENTNQNSMIRYVPLGNTLTEFPDQNNHAFPNPIDYNYLSSLQYQTVTLNDEDVHGIDYFYFDYNQSISVETGLTFANRDQKWQDKVFVPAMRNSFGYAFSFIEPADFSGVSEDFPAEIGFLGRYIEIVDVPTDTSITVFDGIKIMMEYQNMYSIENKTLRLEAVGDTSVIVSVDNISGTVNVGQTRTINGIQVRCNSAFNADGTIYDSAYLSVGKNIFVTYSNGDPFIDEDQNSPAWIWDITGMTSDYPVMGVHWGLDIDDTIETDNPLYSHPLYEGEAYIFPWDFADIEFISVSQTLHTNYDIFSEVSDLYKSPSDTIPVYADAKVIEFHSYSSNNSGLRILNQTTDTLYFYSPSNTSVFEIFFKDPSTEKAVGNIELNLPVNTTTDTILGYITNSNNYSDEDVPIKLQFTKYNQTLENGYLVLDFDTRYGPNAQDILKIFIQSTPLGFEYLGHSLEDAYTTNDIIYSDGSVETDISDWENNQRMRTGVIIVDPEATQKSDTLVMSVPYNLSDFNAVISLQTN